MSDDHAKGDKPASRTRRFARLAGMTASVAKNYTKDRVSSLFRSDDDNDDARQKTNELNGELIAETLGELKGAVMKVGQMASAASDFLPEEMAKPLEKLQKDAPPMDFASVSDQIEAELGSPPELLFHDFDEHPFASASIGQVHRAVTDEGDEAIVKVQYPGVDDACDSDLRHLKFAFKLSGIARHHRTALDALFDEIQERLHEELDYCNEADNVRRFRQMHNDQPDIIIPRVIGPRSARRVLTLTYEGGDSLETAADYPQDTRDHIGELFYHMTLSQLFEHRTLHADPHPGNFAFRPDGKLVLYDYGCVKNIDPDVATQYANLIAAGLNEDYQIVEDNLIALGARTPNTGPDVPLDYYARWREIGVQPCIEDDLFDFATSTIHEDARQQVRASVKYFNAFRPPAKILYINRTVGGVYDLLRTLQPRVPWRQLVPRYAFPASDLEPDLSFFP